MLHSSFELSLTFCAYSGNAIRQQFAAIIQKTLQNANIAIIEVGNVPKFKRIGFVFLLFALVLVAVAITALVITTLTRIAAITAARA